MSKSAKFTFIDKILKIWIHCSVWILNCDWTLLYCMVTANLRCSILFTQNQSLKAQLLTEATDFHMKHSMEVNVNQEFFGYPHSSEYLLLCSTEERNSYRFIKTWRWVNDDNFHFRVNYPILFYSFPALQRPFLICWNKTTCDRHFVSLNFLVTWGCSVKFSWFCFKLPWQHSSKSTIDYIKKQNTMSF